MAGIAPGFAPSSPLLPGQGDDDEIKRLRSTNDLYTSYSHRWEMYLSAYEGGDNVAHRGNLERHPRESEADFEHRCRIVHYLNYCKPLVDFFTYFIFTETIQRDGGPDNAWYENFVKDVNKRGEDLTCFMKQVSDDFQIFGMSYILVDAPQNPLVDTEVEVLTQAVAEDLKLRPYWVLIKAPEIIDWDTDDFDNLTYVKRKQNTTKRVGGEKRQYEKYTEWYLDSVQVTYVDVTKSTDPKLSPELGVTLNNSLNEIPIQVVRFERSKRENFMGRSFLTDLAKNNIEVMNQTSLIQEFLYKQCFNMLAKESDSAIPTLDGNEGTIGVGNVIEYPKGGNAPMYVTPPVDPAEFLQNERRTIINEMFKCAAQDMMSELFNGQGSSGFSQAQSFSKTVPFISNRADTLEAAETGLMRRTMRYLNKTWNGKIKYKDRYEITNVADAMTQLTTLFRDLLMPSETFAKEELKRLVYELDGKLPPEKIEKIISEIEAMDFDEWAEAQKEALVGKGSSPAAQAAPKSTGTMQEIAAEAKSSVATTTKVRDKKNKK